MKSSDHQLGYSIKAKREAKKLTQEKLAELVGVSSGYISEIENKKTIPSFALLCSICQVLNLSLDDLIFGTSADSIKQITLLLSQCSEHQRFVIQSMIEAMLQAEKMP